MIRLIFIIAVILAAFSFSIKNMDQKVTLQYFFGLSTPPVSIFQVVLGTFVLSLLVIIVLLLPEWIRLRLRLRRQRKDLERLEEELNRFSPPVSPSEGSQIEQ